MYVIIVYDINTERVNKVKSFLRQHIFWIQNSVFEGEVTESEFKEIYKGLMEIIDVEVDSVIIYKLQGVGRNPRFCFYFFIYREAIPQLVPCTS